MPLPAGDARLTNAGIWCNIQYVVYCRKADDCSLEVEYTLARKILHLANQIIRNRNEDLKGLGITADQADTLLFFQSGSNRSAVDLKQHLGVTHQAARAVIERMVTKGLLQTRVSQSDARYREVSLTPRGLKLLDIMRENCTHTGNQLLSSMTAADKEKFVSLITQALDNLGVSGQADGSLTKIQNRGMEK